MEMNQVLEFIQSLLVLGCGGLALYFKYSPKAQTKAKQIQEVIAEITAKTVIFIKEAEENYKDTTNMGGLKFNEVVTKLYSLVPDKLKKIIDKDMIGNIVQKTFDEIEQYMTVKLDNSIDRVKIEK